MKKLTIITINFNNGSGLKRTFDSVFEQSMQDFEYIVIDGGSSDSSKQLIEQRQHQIDYWVSESDRGIYHAMNKGIAKASGEYILFLNSGDSFHNASVLANSFPSLKDYDILTGDLNVVSESGMSRVLIAPESLSLYSFYRYSLAHQSSFIRRLCFSELGGYDEDVKITADWKWFVLAVCLYQKSYKKLDMIISDFDMNGVSSDPKNFQQILEEKDKVVKEHFSIFFSDYQRFRELDDKIEDLGRSRLFKLFKFVKRIIGK